MSCSVLVVGDSATFLSDEKNTCCLVAVIVYLFVLICSSLNYHSPNAQFDKQAHGATTHVSGSVAGRLVDSVDGDGGASNALAGFVDDAAADGEAHHLERLGQLHALCMVDKRRMTVS